AAISLMPLVLIGFMLTGYFYTTLKLARHWMDSLYLLLAWYIIFYTAVRGLSVAARRLAYRRALARRKNLSQEEIDGIKIIQEVPLGLDQINQQTLRLVTMTLFILFMVLLYGIWSDVVMVFSYLDSVALWHYHDTSASGTVLQAVTLGNLLFAILLAAITYILTHNLPGLLEVLILSRLQLRQGTTYAFNTVLIYLLTTLGFVAILSILGVSWGKLQWLVAALSVGLGFGLQEIFANFVSGLIILFERPIRIGDVITIGSFTGTVSKIRIRATTIIDFDRKEVIVPNKAFVTERLINWTLSDTITRLQIKIGVAYGSDLQKVRSVLLQAAQENPRILKEPAPQVLFNHFGDSTLDHELWVYVKEFNDRSASMDELHRRIDQLCRDNEINIAFNQLEVHLHKAE
ncbi:MAG: mechanosensitive ion channel domain-containing protein, partial [Enterobacteriaceae bacterium]